MYGKPYSTQLPILTVAPHVKLIELSQDLKSYLHYIFLYGLLVKSFCFLFPCEKRVFP